LIAESEKNMDVIYNYLTVNVKSGRNRGVGHVCIRMERPDKNIVGEKQYRASFAFCSPLDKFNRVIARQITNSRATGNRRPQAVVITAADYRSALQQLVAALTKSPQVFALSDIYVPEWMRHAEIAPPNKKQNN
jgi:hypothetical protein